MKKSSMIFKKSIFLACCISWILIGTTSAFPADNVKLKPGARGKICLECHKNYEEILKNRYVHPLMKRGECTGCHTSHTSSYDNLLTDRLDKLCSNCHKKLIPDGARSIHPGVTDGNCKSCHNSHGSDNKALLIKSGNEMCLGCHDDIRDKIDKNEFMHNPMIKGKGCLNCHEPHSSVRQYSLLVEKPQVLCFKCHKTDKPSFKSKHYDFTVANTNCVSCHNPHGSDKRGMLYSDTHTPVSEGKCMVCHKDPSNPKAFKNSANGSDTCVICHKKMIDQIYEKNRVHWPLNSQRGCLNCHNPHAGKKKDLLPGAVADTCGKCHSDTVELQELSINNSKNKRLCEPVATGNCVACHLPHSGNDVLFLREGEIGVGVCGECHEWETHSSHPFGEKVVDQRNRNLYLNCLSCHKACGTGNNPSMLHFPATYELCVQCHVERKR